jgi:hypothetical protein
MVDQSVTAHTYPDLALPINSAQARVLNAIDGKRSADEILRSAAGAYGADRTLMFIKRLWNYDQIVFDASALR